MGFLRKCLRSLKNWWKDYQQKEAEYTAWWNSLTPEEKAEEIYRLGCIRSVF